MELTSADEVVRLVNDGDTVMIGGSGAGHAVPERFIDALADAFRDRGTPRDLTTVRVVGIGDFSELGFSKLAQPGLMRRTIGSNIGNEPALGDLIAAGAVEGYSFPQGVLSQLTREIAAGRPGLITAVGLDTYVDPRRGGGKQGAATDDLVEVIELAGEEWLFFPRLPIDMAVIRGSVIDEDGNLTMMDEAIEGEMLAMAMAAHNSGGIVVAQAKRLVARGSLPPRTVAVPGALVDHAYIDPDQTQTYVTGFSPYYAGALRTAEGGVAPPAFDIRTAMARRALLEFSPGDICNLGFGVSQTIGAVAAQEGVAGLLTLTVEQGVFGGVPAGGVEGGAGVDYQALIDQPAMFDFYDGGGLDAASLSFAEVDSVGNVNVHAFEGRLRGAGGFPNISARTPHLCFVGTLTTGGLRVDVSEGRLVIENEGSVAKFVPQVREITFSASMARRRGQRVRYITDRAVFELDEVGITLIEVAEGMDPERDVIDRMGFRPRMADPIRTIDPRVFSPETMGLASDRGWAGRSE